MDGLAISTVRRALAAVRLAHERAGFPLLDAELPATVAALQGHRRLRRAVPARQATAATDALVRCMADTCDPRTLLGLRNRALLLLGWDAAVRRGELVAIDLEHVKARPDGLGILLVAIEGDQAGQGASVTVLTRPGSPWCPIRAVAA